MKLKLLLIFISLCLTTNYAQTNLVTNGNLETWTNPTNLDNWTIENNVSQNTSDVAEGSSSASFVISDNNFKPLILTKVPLTSGVTFTISYSFKYLSPNYNGTHPITMKIIRDGSASNTTNNSFAINNNWGNVSVDFTPDQTGDYDLSFSIATFDGEGFEVLIDDIKVFDSSNLDLEDVSKIDDLKVYPTVTNGIVHIEKANKNVNLDLEVSLIDVIGKNHNVNLQNNSIDLSNLKSGIYILSLRLGNKFLTKRIIKR